ncbi:intercompartmental signaling factor BofC [Halalkalibacter urbisdiaboli]|uniref:intercompartmental signaling factor BofC n=1 Tax=Halalkalibacter urbisdiaboli TaxID=1960589 RepID=UPI000B44ED76|nr:intercompartmental signaling factor BofC [Halalkalibacter urbisdiaboli]
MMVFQRFLEKYLLIFMIIIIGLGTMMILPISDDTSAQEDVQETDLNETEAVDVMAPMTINVILEREYLDGEISEEKVQETIWSMEDFWAYYNDWTLIDQNEERMIFRKQINDISPLLKMNGYFGISKDGTLNVYEGEPTESQIIQSFFQVDTSKLKSKQHTELVKGIPVKSREHYEEVLHVFSQYKRKEM